MSKQGKSRMPLIVGIIAAIVILAGLLVVLLTQCTGGEPAATSAPAATESTGGVETYDIYWNLDRLEYAGKSEAGMSSRMPEDDGYFHVRFFKDGEVVELKVADRKAINAIDIRELMGLEFNDDGIVIDAIHIDDMPCEQVAWQFYVASAGGKLIKTNSSATLNGMEILLELTDKSGVWDMTGLSGEVGCEATPIQGDRLMAIADESGEVTHVFLYERKNYMRTHEAECQHCKKTVAWSEWTRTDAAPSMPGHYQLMNDTTTSGQISLAEDTKICLDLNGKIIDGKKNARVYSLHNPSVELAIMDTSEKQNGKIVAHGKGDQGMCVWLRYGVVYLYSGILDASDATSIKNGCAVALQSNTYMYMHGGEIIGGTSTYLQQANGSYTNGLGGAMALANKSKFVLNDGIIRDGFAEAIVTKYDANKQPSTYQRGIGGNIFMSSGSVFEMNGGTIKNGKAGNYGGNIAMDGTAEFTMNGGSIIGGKITAKGKNGGNVFVASKSVFTMNGGSITNGSSMNCAGNLYLNGKVTMNGGVISGGKIYNWNTRKVTATAGSRNVFIVNGNFAMYGGRIDGGVQAIDTDKTKVETTVLLSGYATIDSKTAPNFTISTGGGGVSVYVGTLRDSAKIGVTTSKGIFSLPTKEANLDNFYSDMKEAEVCYVDGCLALGRMNCLCGEEEHLPGCDGKQLFWAPWNAKDSLPTTTGNYYLVNNVTCGQQNVAADAVINLDLNGKKVEGKANSRIYAMFNRVENKAEDGTVTYEYPARLTVTDTSKGHKGSMASHGHNIHNGSLFWLRYGDVTLITGTYDASDYILHSDWTAGKDGLFGTTDDGMTTKAGAAVSVPSGRTFTMYGGKLIGGKATEFELTKTNTIPVPEDAPEGTEPTKEEVKKVATGSNAGTIDLSGNFYLYGGEVCDGESIKLGGNIRINGSGRMYMYGGTVSGGASTGNGGNIHMAKNSVLELHDGEITGGWSKNVSGNIHVDGGHLIMQGGSIYGGMTGAGKSTTSDTANIFVVNGKMTMSAGTVAGHLRVVNYNVQGDEGGSVLTLSGSPVIYGGTVNLIMAPQDDKTGEKDDGKTPTMPILRVSGALTEDAKVYVSLSNETTDFAIGEGYNVTDQDGKAFRVNYRDVYAAADAENNSLFFGRFRCFCGKEEHTFGCEQMCGGKAVKWYAWNSGTTLPTTGNVYLVTNVTGSGSTTVKNNTTLNLDLNGKVVNWKYRAYRIYDADVVANATLTITNTESTDGIMRAQELSHVDQGIAVWVAPGENGTFNLLDGVVLDGSNYTITNAPKKDGTTTEKNGGVVAANSTSVFNMYGGTIIGAKAVRPEPIITDKGETYNSYAPNGGAVTVDGVMHMYGGTITGGSTENQGGNVLVNGDMFMYSGVIADGYSASNAGNVFVHRNGELHMSGDARIEGGESANHSGNVNVDGKMTMTDNATVTGGKAAGAAGNINVNYLSSGGKNYYGQLTMSGNAAVTNGVSGNGGGGNIRMLKGSILTATDNAVISGGVANGATPGSSEPTGGNIYATDGATLTLSGNAKILDGTSYHTAGNVRISNGATLIVRDNVTMTGGKSSDKKADPAFAPNDKSKNANIFCVNAKMEIYGGTFDGNIFVYNTTASNACSIKMAGSPVITKGGSGRGLLTNHGSPSTAYAVINITGAMTGEAGSIVVSNTNGTGVIATGSGYTLTDADALPFVPDGQGNAAGTSVILNGTDLVIGQGECLCGQEEHTKACLELWGGEARTWTAWTSKTTLPTTTGNYYLTDNVDLNTNSSYQQKIGQNQNVVIDLNGKTVTGMTNNRAISTFNTGGQLTITDKSEGQKGIIKGVGNDAQDQGVLWARYGVVNLVAGTIDGSGYTFRGVWDNTKKGSSGRDGGTVSVSGGATFNMYGGTVIGANGVAKTVYVKDGLSVSSSTEGAVATALPNPKGGAVCVSGTFNMYGGTITGGYAAGSGGSVYIPSGGKMFIHKGAEVTGGTAAVDGGTFLVEGQLTLNGGQIIGGNARDGGTIAVYGEMTMESGDVKGGVATGNGGAIVIASGGKFTMNDGTVSGGNAQNAGNIQVSGTMIMNGGSVKEGTSTNNGGGIRVTGTFTMNDGTVSNNWGKNVTGNIHVDGGKFILNGGTIKDGKHGASGAATAMSRNINSVNGKIEFNGGHVVKGVEINNYNVENANYPTTKFSGNANVEDVLNLTYSDGKALPLLNIDPSFTGSLKVYVKNDGIITTGAVTEAQAAKITTSNAGKDVYRISDNMGFPAEDVGKLYVGQLHCICGASRNGGSHYSDICDGTIHVWQPTTTIVDSDGLGADQYYYFTTNVSASNTQLWGSEHNVTYDLNGFKLNNTGGRVLTTYSSSGDCKLPMTFTIVNTANKGGIVVSGSGDEGRIAWLRGTKKTVNVYNVDIDISACTGKSSHTVKKDGMAFSAAGWSNNVNLYKVDVVGGTSASDGNFMGLPGKLNKAVIKDSTITGCSTAQTEKDFGGNGGALWVGPEAQLTLHNTQITGNIAKNNGGGVYVSAKGKLIVSGNTKLTGNTVAGAENNVYLEEGAILETGALGSDAQVGLGGVTGDLISTDVTFAEKAYFTADSDDQQLARMADGLYLQDASAHIHCVCGGTMPKDNNHTCADIIYTPANFGTETRIEGSNNFYLVDNVQLGGQRWVMGEMNLCLNGKALVGNNNSRVIGTNGSNAKLTVTTCDENYQEGSKGTNVIRSSSASTGSASDGSCLWMLGGTIEMYRGTLDASAFVLKPEVNDNNKKVTGKHGAAISVSSSGTFRMYNGTVIGGKTISIMGTYSNGAAYREASHGGSVYVGGGGNFYMYNGIIKDGTCSWGVRVDDAKKNEGWGGNVYVIGTFHMSGGTIQNGAQSKEDGTRNTGWTGSNVTIRENAVFNMTGGTIKGTVRGMVATTGNLPRMNISGSAKIHNGDKANNLYVYNMDIRVGELKDDARIGLLLLSENDVTRPAATIESGVTIDPARFPVHDLELPNASTRSFAVKQEGTELKIVETTK